MNILFATAPFYHFGPSLSNDKKHKQSQMNSFGVDPLLGSYILPMLLREHGCQVEVVFDLNSQLAQAPNQIITKALKADLICLSATSFNWVYIKEFMECIDRAGGHPPIILGGVHPTLVPDCVMRSSPADITVVGEGERTILELIDHFRGERPLENIHGIYYRHNGRILSTPERRLLTSAELGQLPIIQWDEWEHKPPNLSVQTSRGCLMNCAFCSTPFRLSWRPFPIQHVLESLYSCANSMHRSGSKNIYHILFADDCFTTDQEFAAQVLRVVTELFPRARLHIEARVRDLLKPGCLELMAETNVQQIQVGVECGYDTGLRKIAKGLKTEEVVELGRRAKEHNIHNALYYSYIIGFPWETIDEMKATVDFACSIANHFGGVVQICWWLAMPGSRLFEDVRNEYGLDESIFDREAWWFDREVFLRTHPRLTRAEIDAIFKYSLNAPFDHKHLRGGSAFLPPWWQSNG